MFLLDFSSKEDKYMVNWHHFEPSNFEYDFNNDKLHGHYVTFNEAVECFFSDYEVRRNKRYKDRYQLIEKTIGGAVGLKLFSHSSKKILYVSLQDGLYEYKD